MQQASGSSNWPRTPPEMVQIIRAQHGDRLKHVDDQGDDDVTRKHGELHDEVERALIVAERTRINDLFRAEIEG